jgi:hypothetical protein
MTTFLLHVFYAAITIGCYMFVGAMVVVFIWLYLRGF